MRQAVSGVVMAALVALAGAAADAQTPRAQDVGTRLAAIEAREAIRTLWASYGRTLDDRDFTAFGQLFAREGEFIGGAGASAKGPVAVGALLERLIGTNFPNSKGRNMHVYFNESIDVQGDRATAVSRGGFLVAGTTNRAEIAIMATYRDAFVRENGTWKFLRREVFTDIPVPAAPQ